MLSRKTREPVKHSYSCSEDAILELLKAAKGRMTTTELIEARYGKRESEQPLNAASNVRATLNTLKRKIKRNNEDFIIKAEGQVGPRPQQIWLEKK